MEQEIIDGIRKYYDLPLQISDERIQADFNNRKIKARVRRAIEYKKANDLMRAEFLLALQPLADFLDKQIADINKYKKSRARQK